MSRVAKSLGSIFVATKEEKMGTKKTIAILGLTTGQENPLLHKLALNNRLLIVSNHAENFTELSESIQGSTAESAIELIDCAKDGCWEADIIILWEGFQQETKELQRLQTVATQKIVLILTEQEKSNSSHLLFPYSKVVTLLIKPNTMEAIVTGDDQEAVQSITELINKTDYYTTKTLTT